MNKVMIFGGSGFIGRRLFAHLGPERALATFKSRPFADGIAFDATKAALSDLPGDLDDYTHAVILLGHTSPDFCFNNRAESHALNVASIARLIDDLVERRIRPVFASTEVVFDGEKGDYVEPDPANPILVYGHQKFEVERYLEDRCDDHVIVRIAKVYDSRPVAGSLLGDWFDMAKKGGETVRCATDFISSAIHVDDVAEAVVRLMESGASGIYHVGGGAALSRLEIFETLLEEMTSAIGAIDVEVEPCSIHDFPTAEPRPLDVSMRSDKLVGETGVVCRSVAEACRDLVKAALVSSE